MKNIIAAAVVCVSSTPASAQTPNYLWFVEIADGYAKLGATIHICPTFGYTIRLEEAEQYRNTLIEEAAMDGIAPDTARSIIVDAIAREGSAMEYLAGTMPDRSEARMVEITDFLGGRCDGFALHPRWSQFVRSTDLLQKPLRQ